MHLTLYECSSLSSSTLCVVCCVGCVCHSHFPVRDAAGVVGSWRFSPRCCGWDHLLPETQSHAADGPTGTTASHDHLETHLTVPAHLNKHVQHAFISTNTHVHEK